MGNREIGVMTMQPHLKQYNITDMHISFTLTLPVNVVSEIKRISTPDEENDSIFLDTYKVGNAKYRAWCWFRKKQKDNETCEIELNYEIGSARIPKGIPSIADLIGSLSSIEESVDLDCRVGFSFTKRDKMKSIMPLPLKIIDSPNMPFDDISAVILTKKDSEWGDYSVMLGVIASGRLTEMIFFNLQTQINDKLIDEVIERVTSISDKFIVKG